MTAPSTPALADADASTRHLEAALERADDQRVRYHIREAIQLQLGESTA